MMYRLNRNGVHVVAMTLFLLSGQAYANSAPELEAQDQVVGVGNTLSMVLAPTDVDGVVPNVFVHSGPPGATLSDNSDGTRTFSWRPEKRGEYKVKLIVQDGANANLATQYEYNIRVVGSSTVHAAANQAIRSIGTQVHSSVIAGVEAVGSVVGSTTSTTPATPADSDAASTTAVANPEPAENGTAAPPASDTSSNTATSPVATTEPADGPSADTSPVATTPAVDATTEPNDTAVSAPTETAGNTPEEPTVAPISPVASEPNIFLGGDIGTVTKILTDLPVSTSQTNVQHSSIDVSGRYLYTANIEPGPDGDRKGVRLRTVLRQGKQRSDNTWEWKNVTVDDRTLHDRWHSAPSVAVDRIGQIHVAYNMHNFPWQYKRSAGVQRAANFRCRIKVS